MIAVSDNPFPVVDDLAQKVARLQADRERHLAAIKSIDDALLKVQAALASPGLSAPVEDGRRARGKFPTTAEESVLGFIRKQGNPETAEINAHWRGEGRKGTANVTILKLLKQGLIVRKEDHRVRGSRYVAQQPTAPSSRRSNKG